MTESDRINWIAENLKIVNKDSELVNLEPNIGQIMLYNSINLQRSRDLPVRIILDKPRQVGWSTWCEAEGFSDVYNLPNYHAMAISADEDGTDSIFAMTRLFKDNMSNCRPTDYSNRKEIIFSEPHRSSFVCQTAGKTVLGRGTTKRFLHCSEFAFWKNAQHQFGGLMQTIPNKPGTTVVIESTAFGVGGTFYDMFWSAVERLKSNPNDYNGFIPVFFAWWRFPEYQAKLPEGMVLTLDEDEKELVSKFNLCNEQLYWRRLKIAELNGDVSFFRQEYPATAREAFQTTGRGVFPVTWIDRMNTRAAPGRTALFAQDGEKIAIKDVSRSTECWRIWYKPVLGHQYAIGVDTMEGRVSNTEDVRSKVDYHGVIVYDRTINCVVAQYHGQCDQHELGPQVLLAAYYYNNAWVGVEVPNGKTVLDYFRKANYPNLYRRQIHDFRDTEEDTDDYGWRTTTATRPWLVDGLTGVIRDNDLALYSAEILSEMRTFIRDKTGKPIHMPGEHDDLLFGLMIAIQVHLRCSLDSASYPHAFTDRGETVRRNNLAMPGAVDDEADMFDEEEEGVFTG